MKAIFTEKDFKLCSVPVPKGYPQSQTHVGVYSYQNELYLTSSPFPSARRSKIHGYIRAILRKLTGGRVAKLIVGERYENPCLYKEIKDSDHRCFSLMQSKPLMEQPDPYYGYPSYNSDPDIYIEDGIIYVLNRAIFRTKLTPGRYRDEYVIRLYLIKGQIDDDRFKHISTKLIKESTELSVSPCLIKYQNQYILMQLYTNCYNDGESFEGLKYVESNEIEGLEDVNEWKTIKVDAGEFIPWHMSAFEWNGLLYSIVACVKKGQPQRCWQMMGEFSCDLKTMKIFEKPLAAIDSYRGSAYVSQDGIFHLYTTTVGERIRGGKSIDGREILYVEKPFVELINTVKSNY